MNSGNSQEAPRVVRSIWPPLLLVLLSVVMIVWSYEYGRIARQVPLLVSYSLLVLSLFDLASRLNLPFLRLFRDFWGADFRNREMKHNPPWQSEVLLTVWVIVCVAGMLLVGILPTVPAFVLAFMAVQGKRPWLECVFVSAIVFGFVYVVFEMLLEYRLYRGAIFDERGFAAW